MIETDYDAAVKIQYQLNFMRTGEEPELPSALRKRIGEEAADQELLAREEELQRLQTMGLEDMEEIMQKYSTTFYACIKEWPDEIKEDIYKLYIPNDQKIIKQE